MTKHAVRDRLTGEIVYKTRLGDDKETNDRAEAWCRRNLGERGEIVRIQPTDAELAAYNLGKLGGKSKSEAKRKAAQENGRKGGRPKKVQD